MARPVLEVRDLWAQRGGAPACRGVGLRAEPGEVVALVGGPGAGKSSLLACLALELPVTAGSILLHGVDIAGADDDRRAALRSRVIDLVRVGPAAAEPVGSRGVPRRVRGPGHVALAAALGGSYDVVLVDGAFDADGADQDGGDASGTSPGGTAAGDALAARQVELMYALLRRRSARPPAVVVASRNLAAVAAVADTVTVLAEGVVIDRGPVAHVLGAGRWRQPHNVIGLRSA